MNKKFQELKQMLQEVKPIPTLSESTVRMFCIGFYLPLYGSLSYLIDKTTAYRNIICSAKVQNDGTFSISGQKDYDIFAKSIENIVAPTSIEFTFSLTESSYSLAGIVMEDINVNFTVYFQKENYELVYIKHGKEVIRYIKSYYENLEPNEIYNLRDEISNYVFDKVTENMENVLLRI